MKQVVVVVPLYKERLDAVEEQSFLNNVRVLERYDIVAVCPKGLDISYYKQVFPCISYQFYRSSDFDSVKKYDRLLISTRFYIPFVSYEYMLICHFDAWVFKDELRIWCDKGFDYIGAPFMQEFHGRTTSFLPFLSRICLRRVGNGGLCLRRIDSHIRLLKRTWWLTWLFPYNEDVFFTLVPCLFYKKFKYPSFFEANRFAIEHEVDHCLELLEGELPFGCHGWFRKAPEIWPKYTGVLPSGARVKEG